MSKGKLGTLIRAVEALMFVFVLALGWRYPYLAYCMFLNVAAGLAGALRHGGRHGCGNCQIRSDIRSCPSRKQGGHCCRQARNLWAGFG